MVLQGIVEFATFTFGWNVLRDRHFFSAKCDALQSFLSSGKPKK
jgi:hypothetical protein